MQSYPINFTPAVPGRTFQANANLFVYESGTEAAGGNTKILVKPDNEAEVVLKPGQAFRLSADQMAGNWTVHTQDPNASITGNIVIGSGEWYDANTLNTFKLDGTFTNSVNVNNTAAAPVPTQITNTIGSRVPVTLDPNQVISTNGGAVLAYTGQYFARGAARSAGAQQIVAPAANVNGIVILRYYFYDNANNGMNLSLLAKASAPASVFDGDVIDFIFMATSGWFTMKSDMTQGLLRIPPGKGLYVYADSAFTANGGSQESLFYQVL